MKIELEEIKDFDKDYRCLSNKALIRHFGMKVLQEEYELADLLLKEIKLRGIEAFIN